jgi:hypothetical protein
MYSGRYINIDLLVKTKGDVGEIRQVTNDTNTIPLENTGLGSSSSQVDKPYGVGMDLNLDPTAGKGFVTNLEMVIKINPKQWGLGESTRVEKWVFTVANESLVIGAKPLGAFHDRFPYSIVETGFGSEEFIKTATADKMRPLSQTLSWLFNTHMYNVRKAINDVRVVDPSKVVMKDVQRPEPGGVIRLKPAFYGGDVRTAITQLQSSDYTQNHLRDSQVVEQLIQRATGVVDNVMGLPSEGGRKTATEIRSATGFSVNRMKTIAEYMSPLGFSDLLGRMISNTQQYMTMERKFVIAGSSIMDAQRFVEVNPLAIAGYFDFVPVDGTMPVDRLAQSNFWKELIMQLARVPQLAMNWDLGAMLAHTMMLQGERNVQRFKINIMPPGAGPGAGMVPMGGPNGATGGPPSAGGGTGSATTTM